MSVKASFEDKMKELEQIAQELENGDLNLDESMKRFEAGIKISKECTKILDEAEKRITILIEDNGKLEENKYETQEEN